MEVETAMTASANVNNDLPVAPLVGQIRDLHRGGGVLPVGSLSASMAHEIPHLSGEPNQPYCTAAVAPTYSLVYHTKNMHSHHSVFRLGVRQTAEGGFFTTTERESRTAENEFVIRDVTLGVFQDLPTAIASVEKDRRDWMQCANEDRESQIEAMQEERRAEVWLEQQAWPDLHG